MRQQNPHLFGQQTGQQVPYQSSQQGYAQQQWDQPAGMSQQLPTQQVPQFQQSTPQTQQVTPESQLQPQFQPQTQQQPITRAQQPYQQGTMQSTPQIAQSTPELQAQQRSTLGSVPQQQLPFQSGQSTVQTGQGTELQYGQRAQSLEQPSASIQPQWQTSGQMTQSQQSQQGEGIPSVDVVETAESVSVFVDLPGCEEEDIRLQADGHNLTILAERSEELGSDENVFQRERPTRVKRTIQLPAQADTEMAEATFDNGVAKITLPKKEGEKQKQIGFQ